ncbi:sensor histidine kinase [Halalkalibacter sp. APA_J-10(15)]|uniref:sensor histidine kinase n=1 Tax=unclassified Halalkalibacter TaxID=2893063 RepID=UPI001FF58123|nr:sensor histidine kinase [Halalkalibacter sp. APA_J-10(15)]MCK0471869.1 sensor histidine kinase [Halalkalibacter sp. APA_J-10(15)]
MLLKKYRIRQLLFGSFFLFILLLLFIIIYVSYQYSVSGLLQTTNEYQESQLKLMSDDLTSKIGTFEDYSVVLSRQKNFRDMIADQHWFTSSTSPVTQDFSNIIYSIPAIHSIEIYLTSPPIDNIQYPVRYHDLSVIEEESWYTHIQDISSAWLGPRQVEMVGGETSVISYGRKINTSRGELQSVIIINLDPYTVQGWLFGYSEGEPISLLDQNGVILASTSEISLDEKVYSKLEKAKEQIDEGEVTFQIRHDGQYIVATSIKPVNWTLMETTPYEQIIAPSREMMKFLILIGVVALLIALVYTLLLTRSFTKPILHLANVMKRYEVTQPIPRLPKDYKNEFGQLFNGFQDLMNRSKILYESLDEQNKRQREAEIKALQANINPHFLYNTLDQLNWIAMERGDHDMSKMLELLGKMLRIGLSKGASIITIENELSYLDYYLQLQKIQLEDRLDYEMNVSDQVRFYLIPKLTLQPFVENAIIHGFQDGRKGYITIDIQEHDHHITIQIVDNGIGLVNKPVKHERLPTGGYGIRNVRERLDVYYGDEANVSVKNRDQGGVIVTIQLPKQKDEDGQMHETS